ncbi:MAG: hypothetical protein AB7F99_08585 [Vicinamibacterales bacterium]
MEMARIDQSPRRFFSDLDLNAVVESVRQPLMDVAIPEHARDLSPAGFIFHMPRSGSTLTARMLSAPASCACIVEPEALNALLSSPEAASSFRPEWLHRLGQLYCAGFKAAHAHVFLKTSSWAVLREPVFAQAFPEVRSCFVHRDPVEVLVQLLERPVGWMADRARPFILERDSEPQAMSLEEYCARALGRFCEAALRGAPSVKAVAYEAIAEVVPELALSHFSIDISSDDRRAMLDQARYDSDDWSLLTPHDREREKNLAGRATPRLQALAHRFAGSPRQRLLQ